MSDVDSLAESSPPPRFAADDQLPPVEPPSAGFIVQLFVIPGVIVVAIVSVWLMFSWIVHRASARPEDLIHGLEGSGPARWQRASELADMLRGDRYPNFCQNSAAAVHLAKILDRELTAAASGGRMDPNSVNMCYFLCRALGEFEVADGMDVLLTAATTSGDEQERLVRRGAIQALAMRAYNDIHADPPRSLDPRIEPALLQLAEDKDQLVRSETAYALGRIGTPVCQRELEIMVDDPHADTRYNAAVGLASHGNAAALETLIEMLDPDVATSIREEADENSKIVKRALIMKNAMQATIKLKDQNPDADLSPVALALEEIVSASPAELREAKVDSLVAAEAAPTLRYLRGK